MLWCPSLNNDFKSKPRGSWDAKFRFMLATCSCSILFRANLVIERLYSMDNGVFAKGGPMVSRTNCSWIERSLVRRCTCTFHCKYSRRGMPLEQGWFCWSGLDHLFCSAWFMPSPRVHMSQLYETTQKVQNMQISRRPRTGFCYWIVSSKNRHAPPQLSRVSKILGCFIAPCALRAVLISWSISEYPPSGFGTGFFIKRL